MSIDIEQFSFQTYTHHEFNPVWEMTRCQVIRDDLTLWVMLEFNMLLTMKRKCKGEGKREARQAFKL